MDVERIFDEITKLINAITSLDQPNWFDYIQLLFVILGVGISAWAVWMAKRIPEKIAFSQDKIALFDKRFKSYELFQKYDSYSSLIKNNPNGSCIDMFIVVFLDSNKNDFQVGNIIPKIINMSMPIEQMPYLFDDIDKKDVGAIVYNLISLIKSCMENSDSENCKQQYVDSVEKFKEKHIVGIQKTLKLS